MNRRKTIVLILLLALVLSCFAACGSTSNSPSKSDNEKEPGYSDKKPDSIPNVPTIDIGKNEDTANIIDRNRITGSCNPFAGYSSGLMFVYLDYNFETLHCINKKGNLLFSFTPTETVYCEIIPQFYGGYAILNEHTPDGDRQILCNPRGELIRPEDIGATEFYDLSLYIDDGYIFALRVTESANGIINELAIFDNNLNMLVNFSKELYTMHTEALDRHSPSYYMGYLFYRNNDTYLNLNTGEFGTGKYALFSKIAPETESEYWRQSYLEDLYLYDSRESIYAIGSFYDYTPVLDLHTMYGTANIDHVGSYSNGTMGVIFNECEFTQGHKYAFAIIDEAGQMMFDAVPLDEIPRWTYDNGIYILEHTLDDSNTHLLEVYDSTGKIAEKEYVGNNAAFNISEGVITYGGAPLNICTIDLEPLF